MHELLTSERRQQINWWETSLIALSKGQLSMPKSDANAEKSLIEAYLKKEFPDATITAFSVDGNDNAFFTIDADRRYNLALTHEFLTETDGLAAAIVARDIAKHIRESQPRERVWILSDSTLIKPYGQTAL